MRLSPELLIMASFAEPDFLRVMAHFFDRWTRFIDTNVPQAYPEYPEAFRPPARLGRAGRTPYPPAPSACSVHSARCRHQPKTLKP